MQISPHERLVCQGGQTNCWVPRWRGEEQGRAEVSFWVGGNVLDLVSGDFQTNTKSTTYHRKLHYKMTLQFYFFLSAFIYFPLCGYECGDMVHEWRSEDNLPGLGLSLACGSWGTDSDPQAWQQQPFPTDPSHRPIKWFELTNFMLCIFSHHETNL